MSNKKLEPKDFLQAVLDQASASGADDAQVIIQEQKLFEIQCDDDGMELVRSDIKDQVDLTVFKNKCKGQVSLTGRHRADIPALTEKALQVAAAGIEDDVNCSVLSNSEPPSSYGPEFPDREKMVHTLDKFLNDTKHEFPKIHLGTTSLSFENIDTYFASGKGVYQQERRGRYETMITFAGHNQGDSTSLNYSMGSSYELPENLLDNGGVYRLLEEMSRSFNPKPVPKKFVGDLIITPQCLFEIVMTLVSGEMDGALSGNGLYSKNTPYADMIGKQVANPGFTLRNEPRSQLLPHGGDFDDYGIPTRNIDIIKDGILENFLIDYPMSGKLGMPQTGEKTAPTIAPGDQTLDELIAGTKKGVLLARYAGNMPNAQLEISGIAKNSFYIEDGEMKYPLSETMVSGSLKDMFMNIRGISKETTNMGYGIFPHLAVSGVTVSSK